MHENGDTMSNIATKEFCKFMAALDVVMALPTEFDPVRMDLEMSISEAVEKSSVYFSTWMDTALQNATTKGHMILYREKILPALSLAKTSRYSNISTAVNVVTEEAKKKFVDKWNSTTIDIEADIVRRSKIKAVVYNL